MPKIIVPFKTFFTSQYDTYSGLLLKVNPDQIENLIKNSPFQKENNEYIIQPSWPQNRDYKSKMVEMTSSELTKLNVAENATITINLDNSFNDFYLKKFNWWDDRKWQNNVCAIKNLNINAKNSVNIELRNNDNIKSSLEVLTVSSANSNIHLDHMPNLKKIKIINTKVDNCENFVGLSLDHCFGIQEIDLSQCKQDVNYLFVHQINPDCVIKLDPNANLLIHRERGDLPMSGHYFNHHEQKECHIKNTYFNPTSLVLKDYDEDFKKSKEYMEKPQIKIKDVVGNEYIKNGVIEISAKEFALKIIELERKIYNQYFDSYSKLVNKQMSESKLTPINKSKQSVKEKIK